MDWRTENNYTAEKVMGFLKDVHYAVFMGKRTIRTFTGICKSYRFGQITLPALRACGFIRTDGRGFENWKWLQDRPISNRDVAEFIAEIDRQKALIPKRERTVDPAMRFNKTVVQFKPSEPKKAVQTELPMHPVRLTLLNEIRNELNEIRLRLERIEDQIDQESVKKSAGR